MKYVMGALTALMCGEFAAVKLIPMAAAQRGYSGAFGGEWLLIIAAAAIGAKLGAALYDKIN